MFTIFVTTSSGPDYIGPQKSKLSCAGGFSPPYPSPDTCVAYQVRLINSSRVYSLDPRTGVPMQPRAIMTHTPQPLSRACDTTSTTYGCQEFRKKRAHAPHEERSFRIIYHV